MNPALFRRLARVLLSLVAVATVAGATAGLEPRGASALSNCNVADLNFDAEEGEFLRLINDYRAQNGLSTLTVSENLNRAASWMARDLAVNRYFSHTDSTGRAFNTRIDDCDGSPYTGENIAAGTFKDTASEAFQMWRQSSGHNSNMLTSSYRQIGIARYYDASSPYRWYWVTDFSTSDDGTRLSGSSNGGTTTPAPTPEPPAQTLSPEGVMSSPADGSTLATSVRFTWDQGSDSRAYYFYMGTYPGGNNWLSVSMGTRTSLRVSSLPATGQTVYVRLWSYTSAGWKYHDYTYRLPD